MSTLARFCWLAITAIAVLIATTLAIVPSGCRIHGNGSFGLMRGGGPVRTEERPMRGPVHSIAASGGVHLRVVTAVQPGLSVRAPDDILPLIETRIEDGTLHVGLRAGSLITAEEAVLVTVALPSLGDLRVGGACEAEVDGLAGDSCVVDISGASEATVRGSARQVRLVSSGASHADLAGMRAERWDVDCSGASSCRLSGTMQEARLGASGASEIDASGLQAGRVRATAQGASSISLGRVDLVERSESGASSIAMVQP